MDANADAAGLLAAVEATTDAIAVVDADGSLGYTNRAYRELFGFAPDAELTGRPWQDSFDAATAAYVEETVLNSVAVSGEWRGELEFERRDGESLLVEASVVDLDDGGFVAVVRDVSHRRARERRLERLLESTRDLYRADSREAVAATVVETAEEVLDLPLVGVWYRAGGELRPAAMSDRGRALVGEGVFRRGESLAWEAFAAGETRVHEDVAAASNAHNPDTPLESEVIVPVGAFGVVCCGATEYVVPDSFDVRLVELLAANATSALRRLDREGELRRQNERLEQFTGVVSHDLRSPLSVARGRLELARETGDPEEFRRADDALGRMDRLIDELLALAREGNAVEETEPVDLTAVARDAWETTDTGEATLSVETDATVAADRERLRRLLENLFRNAVEHGDADRVTVGELTDGDGFYVADDGPGIPAGEREDVFEPGHTTGGGTGFGLPIVRRAAEAHGWTATVTEGADGGARFEIRGVDEA